MYVCVCVYVSCVFVYICIYIFFFIYISLSIESFTTAALDYNPFLFILHGDIMILDIVLRILILIDVGTNGKKKENDHYPLSNFLKVDFSLLEGVCECLYLSFVSPCKSITLLLHRYITLSRLLVHEVIQ